jgi:hypothetical protein
MVNEAVADAATASLLMNSKYSQSNSGWHPLMKPLE